MALAPAALTPAAQAQGRCGNHPWCDTEYPGIANQVDYNEGLDVGYRWYDANHVTPPYPFGYGLSYTGFRYSKLKGFTKLSLAPHQHRTATISLTARSFSSWGHGSPGLAGGARLRHDHGGQLVAEPAAARASAPGRGELSLVAGALTRA